jgi:hypothetical protein
MDASNAQRVVVMKAHRTVVASWSMVVAALLVSSASAGDPPPVRDAAPSANVPRPGTDKPGRDPSAPPKASPLDLQGDVEDGTPIQSWQTKDGDEAKAYTRTVLAAHSQPAEALANAARRDVKYIHLFEEPAKFRGQIIHLEGRLKRLTRYDAPTLLQTTYDIKHIYEGWIFDPEISGANPTSVLVTELPAGLEPKEKMEVRVAFDGYFFKKYRYKAGDGWRDAPLLIGRTLTLLGPVQAAPEDDGTFSNSLISTFFAVLAGSFGLALALTWWYRRGDRRVHARLAESRTTAFDDPPAEAPADMPEAESRGVPEEFV